MKRTWITCGVCLALSILLMAIGFAGSSGDTAMEKPLYAMIVVDDIGTAVMQQKQGMQTAAAEFGAETRTYTADPNAPLSPQLDAFLAAAGRSGAKGAVLTACNADAAAEAQATADALGIPLVLLSADAPGIVTRVATDYAEQGKLLAEALRSRAAGGPVAVLTGAEDQAEHARLDGVAMALDDAYTVYAVAPGRPLEVLLETLPANAQVLALTGSLTEEAASILAGRLPVWGVDPGDARVALLASGAAEGLVMDMPYAQGYLAVAALHGSAMSDVVYSPSRVVDRETMYLSENVKLVFPLLQ